MLRKFADDFKAFAVKGNAIDMAIGIVIGAAFNKIINSIVSDLMMPPLGLLIGAIGHLSDQVQRGTEQILDRMNNPPPAT